MSDLISRSETIEFLKRVTVTDGITFETGFKQILWDIQQMPSVENKGDFDGMTNGEVLQTLFPYVKAEDTSFDTLIGTNLDKGYVTLLRDWWNAPYQKGGE